MDYTNEAFWFFYWISFFSGLTSVLVFSGVVSTVLAIIFGISFADEKPSISLKLFSGGVLLSILIFISALFVPPKEAFYAGATQAIAETDEVSQTLRNLKTVVDAKLEELGVEIDE